MAFVARLLSTLILLASLSAFSRASSPLPITSKSIQWVSVDAFTGFGFGLEPSGYEDNRYQYLCRVQHQDRWMSGKLYIALHNENRVVCIITDKDIGDIRFFDFQVLTAPPGTLSWVPSSGQNLPENAIKAGTFWDGETAVVCRAFYNSGAAVITGAYSQKHATCYFSASKRKFKKNFFLINP